MEGQWMRCNEKTKSISIEINDGNTFRYTKIYYIFRYTFKIRINKTNCSLHQLEKAADYFHDFDYSQRHTFAYVSRVLSVPKMAFDKYCSDKFPAEKKFTAVRLFKKKNINETDIFPLEILGH